MVVFCLALLFQGCKHHQLGTEIPAEVSAAAQPIEAVSSTFQSVEAMQPQSIPSNQPIAPQAKPLVKAPVLQAVPAHPAAPPMVGPPTASSLVYIIKRGDSLFGIAKAHGTTVQAIKVANQLSGDRILVGKSLKIPTVRS